MFIIEVMFYEGNCELYSKVFSIFYLPYVGKCHGQNIRNVFQYNAVQYNNTGHYS